MVMGSGPARSGFSPEESRAPPGMQCWCSGHSPSLEMYPPTPPTPPATPPAPRLPGPRAQQVQELRGPRPPTWGQTFLTPWEERFPALVSPSCSHWPWGMLGASHGPACVRTSPAWLRPFPRWRECYGFPSALGWGW